MRPQLKSFFARSNRLALAVASALVASSALAADINFQRLEPALPSHNSSMAYGISADGKVVVGASGISLYDDILEANFWDHNNMVPFRWSLIDGMQILASHGGAYSVSADGRVVVGWNIETDTAFRWTSSGGLEDLGTLEGKNKINLKFGSYGNAVSADGNIVVGSSIFLNERNRYVERAFRWVKGATEGVNDNPEMFDLGVLDGFGPDSYSVANGVSADGNVIVGMSGTGSGLSEAFMWTQASNKMEGLGFLTGSLDGNLYSKASAISANGKVVVGISTSSKGWEAFRWTQESGMVGLGDLSNGDYSSEAYATNADGSVVVGVGHSGKGISDGLRKGVEAFRWTEAKGMQRVVDWLKESGVKVADDFVLISAYGVDASGNIIVGAGQSVDGAYPEAFWVRGGSGAVSFNELSRSISATGRAAGEITLMSTNTIFNGAHGNPLSRRVAPSKSCSWVAGDFGTDKHKNRDGDLGLAEVGGCHNFGSIQANFALGKTWADQDLARNGNLDMDGTYFMAETLTPITDRLWLNLGALYQNGKADIRRGYLNAGLLDSSTGSTDISTWGLRARLELDKIAHLGSTGLSPYADLSYSKSHQKAYTETGGGFPVSFDARTDKTTELRLGLNTSTPLSDQTALIGKLEGVHRFQEKSSNLSGNIIGFTAFNFDGTGYQQNWARAGIGIEHRTNSGKLNLMLNATTQGETPNAWIAASFQANF